MCMWHLWLCGSPFRSGPAPNPTELECYTAYEQNFKKLKVERVLSLDGFGTLWIMPRCNCPGAHVDSETIALRILRTCPHWQDEDALVRSY